MIAIIDACGSNLASIAFALDRIGADYSFTSDKTEITNASHVILPGVGHAQYAMQQLVACDLVNTIKNLTQPVLGICLGMQLLFAMSDEGDTPCLEILKGKISKLTASDTIYLPHMGWNQLSIYQQSDLFNNISDQAYVYFVHSYGAPISEYTLATAQHGSEFSAIVQQGNFYGMQFHPERSGLVGEQLLKNFVELTS